MILKHCQGCKSMKVPFVIYIDFGTTLQKTSIVDYNRKALYATEIDKHTAWGLTIFVKYSYDRSKKE